MFPTSEDMISDFHKSAYGYRPRERFWNEWRSADDAEKQVIWDAIHADHKQAIEDARREKEVALENWKWDLDWYIELWGDRENALRRLTAGESFEDEQDVEHWVWKQGILFTRTGEKVYFELCDIYFGKGVVDTLHYVKREKN